MVCERAEIYEKSLRIIRDYFDGEDDDDYDVAPETDYGAQQFSFGVTDGMDVVSGGRFAF